MRGRSSAARRPLRTPRAGEKVLPPLTPPLRLARAMGAAVAAELRAMTLETRALVRSLARLPDAGAQVSQILQAQDGPADGDGGDGGDVAEFAQRRIDALRERYRQRFDALADQWARRMILGVQAQSSAQLRINLHDMAEQVQIQATLADPRMRAVVQASTKSCTALITRIPEQYLGEVQVAVMSAITTGSGLDQLVPYLTQRYEDDARHAHLVALDQVRKASANVNAARLQALGVEEYVWVHVGGERYPRKLHQSYSGKTFRYDDPPVIDERTGVKGKPGDAIFCRCVARPVLRFMGAART